MSLRTDADFSLTRSRRKTLAICVRDGIVEIRAPMNLPKREIEKFISSKEKWISDKLAESRLNMEFRQAFAPNYGDALIYRGKECPLVPASVGGAGFYDGAFHVPPDLPPEDIKAACVKIYRLLAKRDLTAKVIDFAAGMNVTPTAVKISCAKTRWGSCSNKKSLNFSWRLIMADDDLIDYVVVHELAHIREMNHKARFWAIVEGVLPDYRERRARLPALQRRLSGEDWD